MIGEPLGEFQMHVGYMTVTFTVTRCEGRPIAVWQGRILVAELNPTNADKSPIRWRDQTYSAMSREWRSHFTRQAVSATPPWQMVS